MLNYRHHLFCPDLSYMPIDGESRFLRQRPPEPTIEEINSQFKKVLTSFGERRSEMKSCIDAAFGDAMNRFNEDDEFELPRIERCMLHLKLARHFQKHTEIDVLTLVDALIANPGFLRKTVGSLEQALLMHGRQIEERRNARKKKRLKEGGVDSEDATELLVTSRSGKYGLFSLLTAEELKKESDALGHCVGTHESYARKMGRNLIEIFSLRKLGAINPETGKREKDVPVATVEYNVRKGMVMQIRGANREGEVGGARVYIDTIADDNFTLDLFNVLGRLPETELSPGTPRVLRAVMASEMQDIHVLQNHVLTKEGEVSLSDLDLNDDSIIFKIGFITPEAPKVAVASILKRMKGIDVLPEHIAYTPGQINDQTKVYLGRIVMTQANPITDNEEFLPGSHDIFHRLDHVEHIYTEFPEGCIRRHNIEIGGKDENELKALLEQNGHRLDHVQQMLEHDDFKRSLREEDLEQPDWKKWKLKSPEEARLICLRVADLGFSHEATIDQIYAQAAELGLELCPPEVGPQLRLQYTDQLMNEFLRIGMKQVIDQDGNPLVFYIVRRADGSWLRNNSAEPGSRWDARFKFVFRLRKEPLKS